jgi:hypothetical protein
MTSSMPWKRASQLRQCPVIEILCNCNTVTPVTQWWPCSECTSAWPIPRLISQRLTGTVTTNATTSDMRRLIQNSGLSRFAFSAPGMNMMTRLSTISIEVIDTVSDASAIFIASRIFIPCRRIDIAVSPYPNTNASTIDSMIIATL